VRVNAQREARVSVTELFSDPTDRLASVQRRWCMDRGSVVVNGTRTRDECGRWATLLG